MSRDILARIFETTTKAELARQLGISRQAISYWKGRVPAVHVWRVAQISGIPAHEIRPDMFEHSAA